MRLAWLLALVALPALPGAAAPGEDGGAVSCGNTSPLGNSCPAGQVRLGIDPSADAVVAPFVGRITIEATQSVPEPPFTAVLRWRCDAFVLAGWTTCVGPEVEGRPTPGLMADVRCRASAHPSLGLPPAGVWGCVLDPGTWPP